MELQSILNEYGLKKSLYISFCSKVKQIIEDILKNNNVEYHSITNRVKDEESLKKKIIKKNKYTCLDQITDLAGVRIITYYADTVDIIAKIIEEEFEVDTNNTIDKRKAIDPDRFGYMSLHYVVKLKDNRSCLREYSPYSEFKIELQIRTILQHTWAEIEHDLGYKSTFEIPKDIRRSFSSLAGLLEIADREFLGIRNDTLNYSKNVELQIERSFEDIQIDNITLSKYINQSKLINELNRYIANSNNYTIIEHMESVPNVVEGLVYLGYSTLSELENDLSEYKELIKFIADKLLADEEEERTLYNTISLFYLCFAKVLQSGSYDEVVDYLEDNNIGIEPSILSNQLCDIYNEYTQFLISEV